MKEISLTKGKVALIDDEDFDKVNAYKWHLSGSLPKTNEYAHYRTYLPSGRGSLLMHRFIMSPPKDMQVDHINGNGLDNRKANLRICTRLENSQNYRPRKLPRSGITGVHKAKGRLAKPWTAQVKHDRRTINLGYFATREEAAVARQAAKSSICGQFAPM